MDPQQEHQQDREQTHQECPKCRNLVFPRKCKNGGKNDGRTFVSCTSCKEFFQWVDKSAEPVPAPAKRPRPSEENQQQGHPPFKFPNTSSYPQLDGLEKKILELGEIVEELRSILRKEHRTESKFET